MKHLYIARHAKSSWEDFTISDHDRPILAKGGERTKKVAAALKAKHILPGLIISSTAKRAQQTAILLAKGLGYEVDNIKFEKSIYHAMEDNILDELYGLDNNIQSVMIVGHNPAFTDFVNMFSKKMIDNLPTSAVAAITFKTDKWEKISNSKFKLDFILTPKGL